MQWEFIATLSIAIAIILFSVVFIWYLNVTSLYQVIRAKRQKRASERRLKQMLKQAMVQMLEETLAEEPTATIETAAREQLKEVTTMVYFMCCDCGYLFKLKLDEEQPPQKCPACDRTCAFVNVTSYLPEVGEGNPDSQIMALLLKAAEDRRMATAQSAPRARSLMESHRVDALCREAALVALRELLEQKRKARLLRVHKPVRQHHL